jgi:hypothetical protein
MTLRFVAAPDYGGGGGVKWKSESFPIRCPHCGRANELATSFDGHSLSESLHEPHAQIVLICSWCVGVWIQTRETSREFTPEEWLDLPAEQRSEIQTHVKALKAWNARRR